MPQGMSQWARATVVGARRRVRRDMALLRGVWGWGRSYLGSPQVSERPPGLSNEASVAWCGLVFEQHAPRVEGASASQPEGQRRREGPEQRLAPADRLRGDEEPIGVD